MLKETFAYFTSPITSTDAQVNPEKELAEITRTQEKDLKLNDIDFDASLVSREIATARRMMRGVTL